MVERIIEFSGRNRFVVLVLTAVAIVMAVWAMNNVPLDAIPDLSDTQVIVYSRWDRSPDIMEDQVTYPIITALLVIPSMVSPVMAAMAWRMMYGVKYGAINNLGRQLGILDVYFDWFSSPFVSILAVVLVEVWHNTPFMMLVLLAGIQSIPTELYEAARADGAGAWQRFWSITLPLLKFTMVVGVMIRLIDLTKLFGLIFVLTFGGPGGSTETVAFTTYLMGFKDFRMSYAAAMSYVIVGGVLILTLLFFWMQRVREARAAA